MTDATILSAASSRIVLMRLFIGVAQGGALWFLLEAIEAKDWPSNDTEIFRPLLAAALFVPPIAIFSIGSLRPRILGIWIALTTVTCLGLGFHSGTRELVTSINSASAFPFTLVPALAGLLFVCHSLVVAAETDRRWIASFPTYFDVSWKHATQLALAILFVGLFWGVLELGAELFRLIRVETVTTIIHQRWFAAVATTLAFSAAVNMTDSRTGLVRGARALVLSLLFWLMPVMVLIGLAFLATLPFTGLGPLWSTRSPTASLLAAAIVLILLINSQFQDGGTESNRFRILVYTRYAAALMLTPLVVLATMGLGLRVVEQGWTPSRIVGAAFVIAVGCHAFGYLYTSLRSGLALRDLPKTNVLSALVIVALMLALLTPIADPARLSVMDQVRRLESGRIPPDGFDYGFLRDRSGRYGLAQLERLKKNPQGPHAAQIATRANLVPRNLPSTSLPATPASRVANITPIFPAGGQLPESFAQQEWKRATTDFVFPGCLIEADQTCEALVMDLNDDEKIEVVLVYQTQVTVFAQDAGGSWAIVGLIKDNPFCDYAFRALKKGRIEAVVPKFRDIQAGGQRLHISDPKCARSNR